MANSGSKVAISISMIAFGVVGIVGSLAGTLAAALAGLFDPSILTPATSGTGGIGLVPPAAVPGEPAAPGGENPPAVGGGGTTPIEPPGPTGILGGGSPLELLP